MSDGNGAGIDMIRITFMPEAAHKSEIEGYLADLGLDVHLWGDGHVTAFWEEPEGELDEVVEILWEMNGTPFEVTYEAFHRLSHLVYHHEDDATHAGDRAVA